MNLVYSPTSIYFYVIFRKKIEIKVEYPDRDID